MPPKNNVLRQSCHNTIFFQKILCCGGKNKVADTCHHMSVCLSCTFVCNVGQTDGWIKMSLDTEVALGAGDTVLYENPDPPRKGHSPPPLLARVYCGQMAGWIRIPLGTEVGLVAGDIVLYADTAPSTERGTAAPTFLPMSCLWSNGRPSQLVLSSCFGVLQYSDRPPPVASAC